MKMKWYIFTFCLGFISSSFPINAQRSRPNDGFQSMLHQMGGGSLDGASMCRISTRDLLRTAQDTADRILQGVCNPRELDERLILLETRVGEQFNVLKAMVLDLETKLRDQDMQVKRQHRLLHRAIGAAKRTRRRPSSARYSNSTSSSSSSISNNNNLILDDVEDENINVGGAVEMRTKNGRSGRSEFMEFFSDDLEDLEESPREHEINNFNSTIHVEKTRKVFTYYWKVDDIRYRTNNWGWRRSLRSPDFYTFKYGYKMFMKVYPNHEGENIFVHVAVTKGDYDNALEWPFALHMQVSILDHSQNPDDIESREWDPDELCSGLHWQRPVTGDNRVCVGLGFSQNDLDVSNYINDGGITIKFTVFLD